MIERSDLDDNALEISSTAHTIRVLVHDEDKEDDSDGE